MNNLILFNKCESPMLSLHDKLLFREKISEEVVEEKQEVKKYKTHDSLGRPIPKRDSKGHFIKKNSTPA